MSTTSTQENKIQIQNYIDVIPSKFFVALISLLSLGVFKYYKVNLFFFLKFFILEYFFFKIGRSSNIAKRNQ